MRKSRVKRKTAETDIAIDLNIDGSGNSVIETPIPFFTHMLTNFARHGLFDLKIKAAGDVEVDHHHTVEDVGITLGEAFKKALGNNCGIRRCASADVPMMDALAAVALDISNRPYFKFNASRDVTALDRKIHSTNSKGRVTETFDMVLMQEFMKAFSNSAGVDLHVTLRYGTDAHHSIEAAFKALGRALDAATTKDPRIKGVMSTKGIL